MCMPSEPSPCQSFSSTVDVRQATRRCKAASFTPQVTADLGGETASWAHQTSYVVKTGLESFPAAPELSTFAEGDRTQALSCCAKKYPTCNNPTILQHSQELLKMRFNFKRKMRCLKHSSLGCICEETLCRHLLAEPLFRDK